MILKKPVSIFFTQDRRVKKGGVQTSDVRIYCTAPADRPFQCYQSENPICSNRQGLGPRKVVAPSPKDFLLVLRVLDLNILFCRSVGFCRVFLDLSVRVASSTEHDRRVRRRF